jgi:hypothetical protein
MVCRLDYLHLFNERLWNIDGFVAIRCTLPEELREMDSVLRQNTIGSTTRQRDRMDIFQREIELLTVDGHAQNPMFYYKRMAHEDWKVGPTDIEKTAYPRKSNRLAYSKLWVFCRSCVTGPCFLAVLVSYETRFVMLAS